MGLLGWGVQTMLYLSVYSQILTSVTRVTVIVIQQHVGTVMVDIAVIARVLIMSKLINIHVQVGR